MKIGQSSTKKERHHATMRTEIGTSVVPESIQKENLMNTLFKTLSFLAVITLFITACGTQVAQAEPVKADTVATVSYQTVLGKSLSDKNVVDFIASNNCSSVVQLQLCRSAGLVLWIDSDQQVQSVFLYPDNDAGFAAYKGQLPFG